MTDIKFGTDGWRGLIAEDFTFDNVARCAQGVCDYLKKISSAKMGLVVGYDTRFLSPEFAETVATVCSRQGIKVYLATESAPTPVLSYNVLDLKAAGAIIITASHNPAQWNGFKFKPQYAGSATEEITNQLEECIAKIPTDGVQRTIDNRDRDLISDLEPKEAYFARIASLVDLEAIKFAGLNVAVDCMYGAGRGYLAELLSGGTTLVQEIHNHRNPSFPGMEQPEPIDHNLSEIKSLISTTSTSVGIALDGDADRVGIIDQQGKFITTLDTFSMLTQYMLEQRHLRGPLVKGITSSIALNQLGHAYGVDVHEEKVGFKNIGPKMTQVDALIGGEESGGFAFRGHIPERDGILSGLYFLEYMVATGNNPTQLLQRLTDAVGPHSYRRRDITFSMSDRAEIQRRVNDLNCTEVGGLEILDIDTIDGKRFHIENGWVAIRFSGTEPLLRIYAEAETEDLVTHLLDGTIKYLKV